MIFVKREKKKEKSEGRDNMYYSATKLARYVISECTINNTPINNIQLQKILYFIQINFIINYSKIAFKDDIEAWEYGPVVPSVYREFMSEGICKIIRVYPNYDYRICDMDKELINAVIDKCIKISMWDLVSETQVKDSPWAKVYKKGKRKIIPRDLLIQYAYECKDNRKVEEK